MTGSRYAALDLARMLAATAIVIHHAWNPMGLSLGPIRPSLELAVGVFFTISGSVVFRPFVRGQVAPLDHVARRMLRIYPAYLLALLVTLLLTHPYPAGHELQYVLMLPASDAVRPPGVASVAWTLHVEVVFYLSLPVLAVLLRACGEGHRRRAALLVCLGVLSFMALVATGPGEGDWAARPFTAPLMLWAFVPGMLVAWAAERSPGLTEWLARGRVAAAGGLLLLIAVLTPSSPELRPGPMLMATVGMALMTPAMVSVRSMPRAALWLGAAGRTLSYPVYLWHITILVMVAGAGVRGWVGVGAAFVVILLFSAGSWLFVERPAIGLSGRITRGGSRLATPEASLRVGPTARPV